MSVLGPEIVTLIPANTGVPNYANSYFVAADAYDSQKENLVNHTTDFTRSQPLAR
ncbi:hypothetical protein [Candidatus Phyllobacterium onerii]|uniref:hypothetical protein n=1 Tax=Candidatus Phyllobacterium onerii TaxID=3020828 RepID=UPI003A882314